MACGVDIREMKGLGDSRMAENTVGERLCCLALQDRLQNHSEYNAAQFLVVQCRQEGVLSEFRENEGDDEMLRWTPSWLSR